MAGVTFPTDFGFVAFDMNGSLKITLIWWCHSLDAYQFGWQKIQILWKLIRSDDLDRT